MRKLFGEKSSFAIEVGEHIQNSHMLRRVDVWAADIWLTCDDNTVHVSHFAGMLHYSIRHVLSSSYTVPTTRPFSELSAADNYRRLETEATTNNSRYLAFRFMDWGPTSDNVGMLLFREDQTAVLPFAFWREAHHDQSQLGQVFVAQLPLGELALILHEASSELLWGLIGNATWPNQVSETR